MMICVRDPRDRRRDGAYDGAHRAPIRPSSHRARRVASRNFVERIRAGRIIDRWRQTWTSSRTSRRALGRFDPNTNTRNTQRSSTMDRRSTLVEKRRAMASRRTVRNESAFVYALTALAVALTAVGASGAYTHARG